MALEIMKDDVRIIQRLSDYPNQEEGLTAGEMKAKFDEAAVLLQGFINSKIVPAINGKDVSAVESSEYPGCYYRMINETVEWLNPPMVVGTVYRTTERHNGKVVYARIISLGHLPNAATKQVRYVPTDGSSATNILNLRGYATNESGRPQPLPMNYNGQVIELHANAESIFVRTIADNSTWTAEVMVKYTVD